MKILIIVPSFKLPGGVANHYIGLTPHWSQQVKYVTCGRRKRLPAYITLIPDWINLIIQIILFRPNVVLVNTSFMFQPLFRDGVNIIISKLFCRKVVTFVHGWSPKVYEFIKRKRKLFSIIYNKNEFIYVLYSSFKESLIGLGIKCPIKLTTTKVADELVENYEEHEYANKQRQILFLARVDYDKGLDITLEAFKIVHKSKPDIKLCVCGVGPYLDDAIKWVKDNSLEENIEFKGYISGEQKKDCFSRSDIYILPTTHGEGMATSLLEAMAMGLVVISRPVGGVVDFFEQGKMGYLLESVKPEDYAKVIDGLYSETDKIRGISDYNHKYACEHFLASNVAKSIERDLDELPNKV